MKNKLFVLCLLLPLVGCNLKTAEQYTVEARINYQNKDYKTAIALLDKAIEKDPRYIDAFIDRAANKAELSDNRGAIKDCNEVLLIDPDNTLALFNIGKIYCNLKEYKLSIVFFNKAFDTKGGSTAYLDLADNAFVDLGQQYDVPGYDLYYERAIAFYSMGNLKNALNDFLICIEQGQYVKESYYRIGYIYLNAGKNELACANFQKAKENGDNEVEFEEIQKYCK